MPAAVLVVVPLALAAVAWFILSRRPAVATADDEPELPASRESPPSTVLAETADHAR